MQMTKAQFIDLMLTQSNRHMASLTAETKIDNTQMKGGKTTASKYGGFVTKRSRITWNHSIDYLKAVQRKLEKFGLDPHGFIAEEHPYALRALTADGKLTSLAYHKADAEKPLYERRWYLVTYVMNGCVKNDYAYTDANGLSVDASVIHADLYDKRSKKQVEAGLTQIDEQVIYRNYALSSLKNVRFEGMNIDIV